MRESVSIRRRVLVCLVLAPACVPSFARGLDFQERVAAQEAIERVYYSHQLGAMKPFEEAVPRAVLESKVRKYLKQSVALEKYWKTQVTAEMLERELDRMARNTRMPERLQELLGALGNDLFLIQECLVRPALVDRLTRNFFAFDEAIHAASRAEAEALRARVRRGGRGADTDGPHRFVSEYRRADSGVGSRDGSDDLSLARETRTGATVIELEPAEFARYRARAPERAEVVGPLVEEREAFVVRTVLSETDRSVRIATDTVLKESWDSWWAAVSDSLPDQEAESVSAPPPPLSADVADVLEGRHRSGAAAASSPSPQSAPPCDADDTWDNGDWDDLPLPRYVHTAVWTGSLMIVWGGSADTYFNTGGRYDPATDTWTPMSTADAPEARINHTAVWTGDLMVVWGGKRVAGSLDTGGRYDPATDTWTPTSTMNAPTARSFHSAVWTGSVMIVWGANNPDGNTGGRYDPATDTWTPTSTANAPTGRYLHTAVWTGSLMIVWGGRGSTFFDTGGRYDPATDSWAPTSTVGAPEARTYHTAVWTGDLMVVWGGYGSARLNTGGRYDPATDAWTPTSMANAPTGRDLHKAVWTGTRMIVWGGGWVRDSTTSYENTGGRYDPETDSWTPTSPGNAPAARYSHTAVWTGSLMVVWGGVGYTYHDTGSRYDPATDTWTPTSTANAPAGRFRHTAVWTGDRMIVWGGGTATGRLNNGGRYDPATDTWTSTSPSGAPTRRQLHTAVWTGSRMVVWGGIDGICSNTGGRYDPATDTWAPTSTANVPAERHSHTAVWTGDQVVVWGGSRCGTDENTGGRYDPATDTWTPTSTTDAPTGRMHHTAVWTGNFMVAWGGLAGSITNTGGRYEPATDVWTPTSTLNAPTARVYHTAVWSGSHMVVWGGSHMLSTGGRYDPATDTWSPTSTLNAPPGRHNHTAVWTGTQMIVWAGWDGAYPYSNTGGRYVVVDPVDHDGDSYRVCHGDCDDSDRAIYPGAPELCDGKDNGCDGAVSGEGPFEPVQGLIFTGPDRLVWPPAGGAASYDVQRGNLTQLLASGGDFSSATLACIANDLGATEWSDAEAPPPGEGYLYYLAGGSSTCRGTFDDRDPSQSGSRDAEIAASSFACP